MANAQKFQKIPGMRKRFHNVYLNHNQMSHFISNVHNYIMVEVLDSAWKIFQDDIRQTEDLDGLISA